MQIAVCDEKLIFEAKLICGSSMSSDSISRRIIDDFIAIFVDRAVPMLK